MELTESMEQAHQERIEEIMSQQVKNEITCVKGRPNIDQLNEVEKIALIENQTVRGLPTPEQLKKMEAMQNIAIRGLPK